MFEVYTVMDNESIDDIVGKVGSSKEEIYKLNGFSSDFIISPGMMIVVPKRDNGNFWYYTVKKGDNLYNIAKEYGIDYSVLINLNGLDEGDYIYPNQTLIIPRDNINIYLTKENDTIGDVVRNRDIDLDDFVRENENVCFKDKQIVIFGNK